MKILPSIVPEQPPKTNSIAGLVKSIGPGAVFYDENRTDHGDQQPNYSRAMRRAADCGQDSEVVGFCSAMARERRDYGGVVTKTIMLAFNRQIDQLRRRAINQHGISMLSPPSLGLARLLPRIGNAHLSESNARSAHRCA